MQVVKESPGAPASAPLDQSLPRWLRPAWRSVEAVWRPSTLRRVCAGGGDRSSACLPRSGWRSIYAPTDALRGDVQRIDVLCMCRSRGSRSWRSSSSSCASVLPLAPGRALGLVARAAAEIGTVFTTLVLITGSLWGRPIWGAWWVWDDRG